MGKKIIKSGETEIEKHKFHQHKDQISLYDVDFKKVLVSNKASFHKNGFRYFIGYKDGRKVRPLCVMLPKIIAYRRDYDENKYMSFLIENDKLLKIIKKFGITSAILLRNLRVSLFTIKNI